MTESIHASAFTDTLPSARRTRSRDYTIALIVGVSILAFLVSRIFNFLGNENASGIYLLLLVYIIFQLVLAVLERPIVASVEQAEELDQLDVVALVPAYNEDPAALVRCLRGFLEQTRRPNGVVVVDDGSTSSDYREVREWFELACADVGIRGSWERQPNRGKRAAQIAGVELEPGADIYITVDSDSILDSHAVAEALKAFADPEVQSVAGVILTTNVSTNLLTRMMDVYCLGLQLFERSAFSRLGSVMVNSGGCAFYRGDVVRDNITTYLGETLFGKPVHFSDDSMLTLFALVRGRAVQQPTAFAFTLMPDRFSHHRRQQVRWMRGSFIRSGWRMRYLPLDRWAYWLHAMKWGMYAAMTAAFFALIIGGVFLHPVVAVVGSLAAMTIYCITAARYLTVVRSDQNTAQRILTFATVPLAAIWSLTFMRVLRWYAMLTVGRLGWGTRDEVEVTAGSGSSGPGGSAPAVESGAGVPDDFAELFGATERR